MSLQRRIDISSRVNATLRWDIFNMFNRANFGLPDRTSLRHGRRHLDAGGRSAGDAVVGAGGVLVSKVHGRRLTAPTVATKDTEQHVDSDGLTFVPSWLRCIDPPTVFVERERPIRRKVDPHVLVGHNFDI